MSKQWTHNFWKLKKDASGLLVSRADGESLLGWGIVSNVLPYSLLHLLCFWVIAGGQISPPPTIIDMNVGFCSTRSYVLPTQLTFQGEIANVHQQVVRVGLPGLESWEIEGKETTLKSCFKFTLWQWLYMKTTVCIMNHLIHL